MSTIQRGSSRNTCNNFLVNCIRQCFAECDRKELRISCYLKYPRCYPMYSSSCFSFACCKNIGCKERKQKKQENKAKEGNEKSDQKLICKQRCLPVDVWDQKMPSHVTLKDICHEVSQKNFEMATFGFKRVYRRGYVFNVGKATSEKKGENLVALKWIRSSHLQSICHKDHYSEAINEAKDCAKVVKSFMRAVDTKGWKVKVLIPKKAKQACQQHSSGHMVIVEPFLQDFSSFYKSPEDIRHKSQKSDEILQALIHFSIKSSDYRRMMTNLEGCVDVKNKTIFLSGPVIRNRGARSFHGKEAHISAFLKKHKCSIMCEGFENIKLAKKKVFCFALVEEP